MKKIIKSKLFWFFLLCAGAGMWFWFGRAVPSLYTTEPVRRGNIVQLVSASGELRPSLYADLSFRRSGTVHRVYVLQGDRIAKGDIIAELDASVLDAKLNESLVALRIAEENEKLARRNWNSLKPEERQAKKLATEQARRSLDAVRSERQESILLSPIDGMISSIDIRFGETALLGTKVARAVESADLIIEVDIPESDITDISVGQRAKIRFDALNTRNDSFDASVIRIDREATIVQDVVYYKVRLSLEKQDDRLRSGMSADADIHIAEKQNALIVPRRAVREEGSKSFVNVLAFDQHAEKREVKTGIQDEEGNIEIVSGVRENEMLIIEQKKIK